MPHGSAGTQVTCPNSRLACSMVSPRFARRMLIGSSAKLPRQPRAPIESYPHEHGSLIYAHDLDDVAEIEPEIAVPDDLRACIRFARGHCCDWLTFDADARTYEDHSLSVHSDIDG